MWKTRIAQIVRPYTIVTISCLIYALLVVSVRGDALALVTIGTDYSPEDAIHSYSEEGYDGQFVYYIARDPEKAASLIDVPAYRYQRILLPVMGRMLAVGNNDVLPWALLVVNLVALAIGTKIVEDILRTKNLSRWYAVGYGLTLGTFGAARLILPEPLAYGLALGGIWAMQRERWLWGALLFALAVLAKETTLIIAGVYGLQLLYQRNYRTLLAYSGVILIPFGIWQMMLYANFGTFGIGSGGALATSFEIIPFMGVWRILLEGGWQIFAVMMMILLPFVLVPTLWGLWRGWQDYRNKRWTTNTLLLTAHALVMLFVPFSTYREPLGILRFIVGLQIAVILYAAERRKLRVLRNATIWMVALLFLFPSDFNG